VPCSPVQRMMLSLTCGDILDALPEDFDWTTCAVHAG
jgi:hypothetical protein